jgi:hypothetical protein
MSDNPLMMGTPALRKRFDRLVLEDAARGRRRTGRGWTASAALAVPRPVSAPAEDGDAAHLGHAGLKRARSDGFEVMPRTRPADRSRRPAATAAFIAAARAGAEFRPHSGRAG